MGDFQFVVICIRTNDMLIADYYNRVHDLEWPFREPHFDVLPSDAGKLGNAIRYDDSVCVPHASMSCASMHV